MILAAVALVVQAFAHLDVTDAQNLALAFSPDVVSARAHVAEQQANLDAARASFGPALVANYSQAPQLGPDNVSTIAQHTTTVGGQITLGDLFAYSPVVAQAAANVRAAQADETNAERAERLNVANLYYGALSAAATRLAREAAVQAARGDQRAAELRFKAGDAPRLDLIRASVAFSQASADLNRARADEENALAALSLETGVARSKLITVETPAMAPAMLNPDLANAVAQALASRPELASSDAAIAAEEHAVAVARTGILPIVTVDAGYASGTDTNVKIAGPSVGVNLTLPLGLASADRARAEHARLDQARAQREKIVRQVTLEVGTALRNDAAQVEAERNAEQALEEARAERGAVEIGYKSGANSSLDVEISRSAYTQALVSAIQAYYAQLQARDTFELVTGKR